MLIRHIVFALSLVALVAVPAFGADDASALVFRDGTTIEVAKMVVRGGRVELQLPNGRLQAYDLGDVDLEASGLLPEQPVVEPTAPETGLSKGSFGAAIAAESTGEPAVNITDSDVKHVRPTLEDVEEGEDEEGASGDEAKKTSLVLSALRHEASGESLWVSGKIFNSGDLAVTTVTLTAFALDENGATVGQGTKTLGGTLDKGATSEFLISIPGSATATDIRVTATAAVSDFTFDESAAPPSAGEDEGEDQG